MGPEETEMMVLGLIQVRGDTPEVRFSAVRSIEFESAVTAQNDVFKCSFHSSY